MGKSQPAAPDPVATANAQAAANRNTAITQQQLNMTNQVNPWGNVTYDRTGTDFVEGTGVGTDAYHYNPTTGEYVLAGENPLQDGWQAMQGSVTPQYTQTTTLTPEQQAIFDQTQAAQGNLAGLANDQSAAVRDLLNSEWTFGNDDADQWAYDRASPRILEQQRQNELAARNTLASKGIREGSPAFISEMQRLTNANTDQLNQLALQGRGQAFSESLAQRNQPINEITALLSGSQVSNPAQMSGPTPQTSVGGVDYSGLVQQNYQNQVQANNAKMGGIGGLFGTGLSAIGQAGGIGAFFSDRRLKENIVRVGSLPSGLPLYSYNYKWGGPPMVGVMADEAIEMFPDAVFMDESGFMKVNYGGIQ